MTSLHNESVSYSDDPHGHPGVTYGQNKNAPADPGLQVILLKDSIDINTGQPYSARDSSRTNSAEMRNTIKNNYGSTYAYPNY